MKILVMSIVFLMSLFAEALPDEENILATTVGSNQSPISNSKAVVSEIKIRLKELSNDTK